MYPINLLYIKIRGAEIASRTDRPFILINYNDTKLNHCFPLKVKNKFRPRNRLHCHYKRFFFEKRIILYNPLFLARKSIIFAKIIRYI